MLGRVECPEPRLTPKERPFQNEINRIAYMQDDRDAFAAFISDKMDYFGDIFREALTAIDVEIIEEKDYYEFLRERS